MPNKTAGYILIYVIGILVFLGVVGLGVAYTLRINAQLVLNEKEILQNDRLLESAAQYALAQLTKAKLAEPAVKAMDPSAAAKLVLWKKGGLYRVRIQGQDIAILLEDAGNLPDINVLTKEEIQRIFESFGASSAEAAALAGVLIEARDRAGSDRGGGGNGFSTLQQVLGIEAIPARYRFGVKPEAESLENSPPPDFGKDGGNVLDSALERALELPGTEKPGKPPSALPQPGLDKLVAVGTGVKTVDVNRAPLQVIFALVKTDAAALARLDAARKAKPLTVADAAQILGESARQALRDGDSPIYRIKLIMEKYGRIYNAVAIAREDGGNFKILSYRISQPGYEQ